jgi:hypothetical protein
MLNEPSRQDLIARDVRQRRFVIFAKRLLLDSCCCPGGLGDTMPVTLARGQTPRDRDDPRVARQQLASRQPQPWHTKKLAAISAIKRLKLRKEQVAWAGHLPAHAAPRRPRRRRGGLAGIRGVARARRGPLRHLPQAQVRAAAPPTPRHARVDAT